MTEKDFNDKIHVLTGLIDDKGCPIVRMLFDDDKRYPIGFGKDKEWNETHRNQ
jgi:hypothetical protein